MKLLNCGCSFAHGYNSIPLDNYNILNQPGLMSPGTKRTTATAYKSAGWHLAQSKDMEYIDIARNGNSNEGILRTLRTYIHLNDTKNLFVLIGWTHAFRREYMSVVTDKNKNEFTQYREIPSSGSFLNSFAQGKSPMMVEFNERNFRPLAYDDHIEYRQYNIMLQAQQLLQLKNIPYLMYNACGNEHQSNDREVLQLKDQIDKKNFFRFTGPSFDEYVLANRMYLSKDGGHPGPKGHQHLADLLRPKFDTILTKTN
jgi:hypothetical protein